MIKLSQRCESLKNNAVNVKPVNKYICAQRDFWYAKGLAELTEDKISNPMLCAAGIASVIKSSVCVIQDGELLVGYNYGDAGYEYMSGDPNFAREQLKAGPLSEDEINWFQNHAREGYGKFKYRGGDESGIMRITQKDREMQREIASTGFCNSHNHSVIDHAKVLRLGFEGLSKEAASYSAANGGGAMYDAIIAVCEAGCVFGERYARQAERDAAACGDPQRQAELLQIAETCRRVPRYPASSFREALQSLLFSHIINTWEDNINANSLGRLDQILYPYYKADIECGKLTRDEAFELLCCLWIKLYRDYDVQQSCVGGTNADGKSEVNELSYLMLDVTEALGFVRCMSVRFSYNTEKEFLLRALEVTGHLSNGIPFFFNDDVIIPALEYKGIPHEDAVGYTDIGCVETVIPGKSNPHAVSGRCNLLKAVEYAFADGHSIHEPQLCPGLETGDPARFTSYDSFKTAVWRQIRHILDSSCRQIASSVPACAENYPMPYKSLLTDDCLCSGKDYNAGGPKYSYYQICLIGIPNLADSLAAVRELVYKRCKYTIEELTYQLEHNFPDEAVRLDFINNAPKYGNDIAEVDDIAVEALNYACDILDECSEKYGYSFHAQPFSFLWMIEHGATTAATPDGRRDGEILAYSLSPMQGRDFGGLTALFNTLAKLPTKRAPGTTSAIVEVDPLLFDDTHLPLLAEIFAAAADEGLCNVQFNMVDANTLKDAQLHPENHVNLAVRVSGFSQKFVLLSPELQNHIIARTKHATL
jgi:Pyruvate-formate lyase